MFKNWSASQTRCHGSFILHTSLDCFKAACSKTKVSENHMQKQDRPFLIMQYNCLMKKYKEASPSLTQNMYFLIYVDTVFEPTADLTIICWASTALWFLRWHILYVCSWPPHWFRFPEVLCRPKPPPSPLHSPSSLNASKPKKHQFDTNYFKSNTYNNGIQILQTLIYTDWVAKHSFDYSN